jgi:hypothetical protein
LLIPSAAAAGLVAVAVAAVDPIVVFGAVVNACVVAVVDAELEQAATSTHVTPATVPITAVRRTLTSLRTRHISAPGTSEV